MLWRAFSVRAVTVSMSQIGFRFLGIAEHFIKCRIIRCVKHRILVDHTTTIKGYSTSEILLFILRPRTSSQLKILWWMRQTDWTIIKLFLTWIAQIYSWILVATIGLPLTIDGMNVAVTGGSGFIGSHLVDHLLTHECHVTVLDSFERGSANNLPKTHERLTVKKVNLLDCSDLGRELLGIEVLFDLAAKVSGNRELYQSPANLLATNLGITMNVAKAAAKAHWPRCVLILKLRIRLP